MSVGSLWVVLWGRCGLLWCLCGVGVCFCGDLGWSLCGVSVGLCEPMRVFVGSLWVSVESMRGVRCGPLWAAVGGNDCLGESLCGLCCIFVWCQIFYDAFVFELLQDGFLGQEGKWLVLLSKNGHHKKIDLVPTE